MKTFAKKLGIFVTKVILKLLKRDMSLGRERIDNMGKVILHEKLKSDIQKPRYIYRGSWNMKNTPKVSTKENNAKCQHNVRRP